MCACVRVAAPEPGGSAGTAEAGGAGDQLQAGGGHAALGGPRPQAESPGGGGQTQVPESGGEGAGPAKVTPVRHTPCTYPYTRDNDLAYFCTYRVQSQKKKNIIFSGRGERIYRIGVWFVYLHADFQ